MDLDGTVVPIASIDGREISRATKEAIARAQTQGLLLAAATGRPWEFAKTIIQALELKAPCIIEGGARIIAPDTEKTLWGTYLDDEAARSALDIVKREAKTATVAFEGEHTQPILQALPIETVNWLPKRNRIVYFLGIDKAVARRIARAINDKSYAAAHVTPSWHGDLLDVHVTHPEGTKEHALSIWHGLVHINKSETIAMGDSANDIPLFQSAGFKVAVKNASPELKKLADYIAPAQENEALRHVIERFLF